MDKKYLIILLLVLINNINIIYSQRLSINVDYNINKDYIDSQCGINSEPHCTSLEDAGKRAILESELNNTIPIYIYIHSDINGSMVASVGNLYSICNVVVVSSTNTSVQFTVDGSNTNQSFLSIEEPNDVQQTPICVNQRKIYIQSLRFINWNQTLFKININQETQMQPIDQSKSIALSIARVNISYSSSILWVYPKNPNQIYNYNSISITASATAKNLYSSNLMTPNSVYETLPPFYLVGCSLVDQVNLENSNISLTPYIYFEGGSYKGSSSITNNTFSCNPFIFMYKNIFLSGPLSFKNNEIMTFIYFLEHQTNVSPLLTLFANISVPAICNKNQFLNNKYHDSFNVYSKGNSSFDSHVLDLGTSDKKPINYFYVEDGHLDFTFPIFSKPSEAFKNLFKVANSSIGVYNVDLSVYEFPIVGSNSSVFLDMNYVNDYTIFKNETFCNCTDCLYYGDESSGIFKIDTTFRHSLCNPEPSNSSSNDNSSSSSSSTPSTTSPAITSSTTTTSTIVPTTTSTTTTSTTTSTVIPTETPSISGDGAIPMSASTIKRKTSIVVFSILMVILYVFI
ncbi:hypothetical protein RB653_000627 [Dictyostelium firmibasis]|uniref:Uncharacterized protein n=1 Tax=Dictyostelium firmibasis TaxID=79012 RepID=A0AAN7U780_9MYCE